MSSVRGRFALSDACVSVIEVHLSRLLPATVLKRSRYESAVVVSTIDAQSARGETSRVHESAAVGAVLDVVSGRQWRFAIHDAPLNDRLPPEDRRLSDAPRWG